MSSDIERSAERDTALRAMLPHVAERGWTQAALRDGLAEVGLDPDDARLLFPNGALDMVEAYADLADRRMAEAALDLPDRGVSRRVRAVIALRLRQCGPEREAVRRALALLAVPGRAGATARITARTVDAIWHAAGDRSADFSWYTKRAILAGVYGVTLLFWLRDWSEDDTETLAFLDRRLAQVGRIGKLRARLSRMFRPQAA